GWRGSENDQAGRNDMLVSPRRLVACCDGRRQRSQDDGKDRKRAVTALTAGTAGNEPVDSHAFSYREAALHSRTPIGGTRAEFPRSRVWALRGARRRASGRPAPEPEPDDAPRPTDVGQRDLACRHEHGRVDEQARGEPERRRADGKLDNTHGQREHAGHRRRGCEGTESARRKWTQRKPEGPSAD